MTHSTLRKSARFIQAVRRPPVQSGQDTSLAIVRSNALGLALEKDPALIAMNSAVETLGAEVKDVSGKLADARKALEALDTLARLQSSIEEAERKRDKVIFERSKIESDEKKSRQEALRLTGMTHHSYTLSTSKIQDLVWALNVDVIIETYDLARISTAIKLVSSWYDCPGGIVNSLGIRKYFTRDMLEPLGAKLRAALSRLQAQDYAEKIYEAGIVAKLKAHSEYQGLLVREQEFFRAQSELSAQKEEATRCVTHLLSSLEAEEDEKQERFDAQESERFNRTLKKSLIGGTAFGVVGAFTLLATPLFPVPAIFFAGAAAISLVSGVLSRKKKYKRAKLDEKNLKKHLNAEIPRLQDKLLKLTTALKESAEVVQTLVGQQERRFSSLKSATANEAGTSVQATADKTL